IPVATIDDSSCDGTGLFVLAYPLARTVGDHEQTFRPDARNDVEKACGGLGLVEDHQSDGSIQLTPLSFSGDLTQSLCLDIRFRYRSSDGIQGAKRQRGERWPRDACHLDREGE